MAQKSWPYQTQSVEELEWRAMARLWRTSGVIENVDNELEVTEVTGSLQVDVASGETWLDGHYYASDATERLTLDDADLNDDRIDLIVVRSDAAANESTLAVITGTPAADPAAPTVTQDHEGADVYEIALAEVLVEAAADNVDGNVTDRRTLIDRNVSKTELDNATTPISSAQVQRSTNRTITTSTVTALPFESEAYDNDGWADLATNPTRLTVPAGVSKVRGSATISWDSSSGGGRMVRVVKNGTDRIARDAIFTVSDDVGDYSHSIAFDEQVSEGDYFEVEVYHTLGSDLDVRVAAAFPCRFSIEAIE